MNEENTYNLIDEPWIPVLMHDGTNRSVSLGEIFADTKGDIADLALNPYERVAVFRLLLCIAQAALGPERLKDERAWRAAKDAVGPVSADYLKKWHDRFFLYGPHAFLQPDCIALVKPDGATSCDKLVFQLASGNNSTLYDHDAVGDRILSDAKLALGLLVYQNFSSSGMSGQSVWDGIKTEKSIQGAPCREQSMLFSILQGCSLLDSIWLNFVTDSWIHDSLKTDWGYPFWEFDELTRKTVFGNENTYLGHLVPFSRAIKLTHKSPVCILGEALHYPQISEWREPMASVKSLEAYVASNPSKMPWRELGSLLSIRGSGGRKSALVLRHLESMPDKEFTLWTGGLYSEKAKEINTVEWKIHLSIDLLEDSSLQRYEEAIIWADRQRDSLYFACKFFALTVKTPDATKPLKKNEEKKLVGSVFNPAEKVYWDLLAQPDNQKLVLSVDSSTYLDDWKKACRKAAEEAYRRACPTATARQMEAYAQGFAKLWVPDGKKGKAIDNAESEENEGDDHA